ncbi:MAG TPA: CoA transferase [Acidimicrobiales bacterium]|nr:CoA transferase [Acidimicrobiales bacterium]
MTEPIGPLDRVVVSGPAHVLPSTFPVTKVATEVIAAATLAVAEYAGIDGDVTIDTRHAATAVRSERHLRLVGQEPGPLWDPIAGDYPARDGWIRLHTNYPHHRAAALAVLGAAEERDVVAAAVREWAADDLEAAVVAAGGAAAAMRTAEDWAHHEHGRHLVDVPALTVEPIGDGPPLEVPLDRLRVLDLTRVIAGPVASRFLAGWGADVLRVEAPGFSDGTTLAIDVGIGKRSCGLDLRQPEDRECFERLVAGADVVVHGYRPGALAGLGYPDDALAALRPGLVIASLSAYGPDGPWAGRRGFDSLVQMSSGIAATGAAAVSADHPVPLPCQLLDHATGYLLAVGILRARRRQRADGGTWSVGASLSRTAAWLSAMDRVDALDVPEPSADDAAPWLESSATPWGEAVHVRPPGAVGGRTPHYRRPPSRPRADRPEW